MKTLIFFLCLISVVLCVEVCPVFECEDFNDNSTTPVCAKKVSTSSFQVASSCPWKNQTCNLFGEEDKCTYKGAIRPGYKFNDVKDCMTGEANGTYCAGKKLSETCSGENCGAGLYCKNHKCVTGGNLGDPCNGNDQNCQAYLMCYENKCQELGSQKAGTKLKNTIDENICETRWINSSDYCTHGPNRTGSMQVNLTDKCEYEIYGKPYTESTYIKPTCGRTSNKFGICKPGASQQEGLFKTYRDYLKLKPACPAYSSMALCDQGIEVGKEAYEAAVKAYYQIIAFPFTSSNTPTCVQKWQLPQYWSVLKQSTTSDAQLHSPLILMLISLFAFILL